MADRLVAALAVTAVAFALVALGVRAVSPTLGGPMDAVAAAPAPPSPLPPSTLPPSTLPPSTLPSPNLPSLAALPPTSTPAAPGPAPDATKRAVPRSRATPRTASVPATGPGTFRTADLTAAPASARGRLIRYDVRVERNLDLDAEAVARTVAEVLEHERSWQGTGRWRFELVAAGDRATHHVYLTTPGTTDRLCAPLRTRGEVSCQNGPNVVLNAKRWVQGADAYGSDLAGYRTYLLNHEMGHALGYGHVPCPGRGELAPVMLQQTKGLAGCRKNPWPRAE